MCGASSQPVQAEVRKRLGNFIMAEDDQTLEGVVLAALTERQATLALVETFTSGQIAARIGHLPGAEHVFRCGIMVRDRTELHQALDLARYRVGRRTDAGDRPRRWRAPRALTPGRRMHWWC